MKLHPIPSHKPFHLSIFSQFPLSFPKHHLEHTQSASHGSILPPASLAMHSHSPVVPAENSCSSLLRHFSGHLLSPRAQGVSRTGGGAQRQPDLAAAPRPVLGSSWEHAVGPCTAKPIPKECESPIVPHCITDCEFLQLMLMLPPEEFMLALALNCFGQPCNQCR